MNRDDEGEVLNQLVKKAATRNPQALEELFKNECFLSGFREICESRALFFKADPNEVEKGAREKIAKTINKYDGKTEFMKWVAGAAEEFLIDQLGRKAKGGDLQALKELLESDCFQKRLKKVCERLAGQYGLDPKDVEQAAKLKILNGINTYSGKESFSGWASTIARNMVIDQYRHNKCEQNHIDSLEKPSGHQHPTKNLVEEKKIDDLMLKEMIDRLSGEDQELLRLKVMGYTAEEMAEILELTPKQVYRMLEKVSKKLVTLLKKMREGKRFKK